MVDRKFMKIQPYFLLKYLHPLFIAKKILVIKLAGLLAQRVGVIWTGRWAGERKERITEVTL